MAALMPTGKQQFLSNTGTPLVGGKVYAFEAGTVDTPKDTYKDVDATEPQEHPIILNARGEPEFPIFWRGSYKVVVRDALGALVYSVDNYQAPNVVAYDALAGSAGAGLVGFSQAATYTAGTLGAKGQQIISVKDAPYNVVGGGTTDDSAAIAAALAAAVTRANSGKPTTLWFPTDIYRVDSSLGTYSCSNLTIDLNGSTIDASNMTGATSVLRFEGTLGAYTDLSTNAAEGDTYALVASTVGFTRGDWVKIVSNEIWDPSNTSTRFGEINQIPASDNATATLPSTRIYLAAPLQTRYNTAYSAKIAKITPIENVTLRNGQFIGPTGLQDSVIGLRVHYAVNLKVMNCVFSNFDERAVYAKDVVLSQVAYSRFKRTKPVSLGYGVSFVDAAQDNLVTNCVFEDVRHAFSTNNNVSTDYGITRRCTFSTSNIVYSARSGVTSSVFTVDTAADTVIMTTPSATFSSTASIARLTTTGALPSGLASTPNYYLHEVVANTTYSLHLTREDAIADTNRVNISSAGTGTHTITVYPGGDAVDTHGGADYITFSNLQIIGSSSNGINIECPNSEVLGCTIIGSAVSAVYVHNEADRVGSATISDNKIKGAGACGVLVSQGTRGTPFEMRRMAVNSNNISDTGNAAALYSRAEAIAFNGLSGTTQDASVVGLNVIEGGGGGGIYADEASGLSMTGNSVMNTPGPAFRLVDCRATSLVGNTALLPSTTATNGIEISATAPGNTNYVVLEGNVVGSLSGTVTGTGISVDNNSTNVSLGTNPVYGFTTLRSLGTGSGNSGFVAKGSATYDPASLADGAGVTTTVAATGASLGDVARASFSNDLQGITLTAWVSAANMVSVRFQNESGAVVDLASGTLKVSVERI